MKNIFLSSILLISSNICFAKEPVATCKTLVFSDLNLSVEVLYFAGSTSSEVIQNVYSVIGSEKDLMEKNKLAVTYTKDGFIYTHQTNDGPFNVEVKNGEVNLPEGTMTCTVKLEKN